MKRPLGKIGAALFVLVLAAGAATHAQSPNFTVLHSFTNSPDGAFPFGGLLRDPATGNLYGTTLGGGSGYVPGIVFKVDSAGNETILYRFGSVPSGFDPTDPYGTLVMDTAGNLYGTTRDGGTFGNGTVFKLDTSGNLTVLHSFLCAEGANPYAGLLIDAAGNLYGTTSAALGCGVFGTVFKIDPAGNFTILHFFTGSDGCCSTGGVIMDVAGNLYGTGGGGGAFGQGVVFKLDPSGNETVLHSFTGADGASPAGGLVMDAAGNLYGTTGSGGSGTSSTCSSQTALPGCGTVFKLDPSGNLTVLYSFAGIPGDGALPDLVRLVMDAAGNLYGTTLEGGPGPCTGRNQILVGCGTVFKIGPSGNETLLYSFTGGSDGAFPVSGLVTDAAGNLYGTASSFLALGGFGTVFKLTPVSTLPTITVSFPAHPSGQDGFFKAGQTPVVGSVSASDPSNVTAISCSDSLGGLTAGALTGGGTTSAGESLSVNGDGIHVISCTATDGAGNSGAAPGSVNTATIQIDTTPPTITFSGNQGAYTADQTVSITTTAADALSSVVSLSTQPLPNSFVSCAPGTLCANFTIPAYRLGPGMHTISATATDGAGNAASASTGFTVLVTPTITSISPTNAIAGGAAFTLTVSGTNFVSGSTVNFNGNVLATTFVSATQLAAVVPASDIASAGSFNVTVTNPGGTSKAVTFTVVTPQQATQAIINSVNALFSQGAINGGQNNSLVSQLQHAISMMNAGKNAGAIGNLQSFISEVNDLLSSGVLSPSQAASLISAAQAVIAPLS